MIDPSGSTRADTAEYIEGMARELETLAADADLGFLAYLLAMVAQEARRLADGKAEPPRRL